MNSRYDVPGYGYQTGLRARRRWPSRGMSTRLPVAQPLHARPSYSWLFSGIGGISQESGSTAYKRIVIDPQIVGDLRDARVSFRSPYGLIRSEWKDAHEDEFVQTIEIPANATLRPVFACPRPIRRKSPRAASPYRAARDYCTVKERCQTAYRAACRRAAVYRIAVEESPGPGVRAPFRRRVCVTCRRCFVRKVRMTAKQSRYRGIPHRIPRYPGFTLPLDERHVVQTGFRCEIPFVPELGTGDLLGAYSGNYGSTYWTACRSR